MATIAVLGNHSVSFSTESELDWTLENLGHTVVRLQESTIRTDEVVTTCRERGVKLLIWVHTHGWEMIGNIDQGAMLRELRRTGIKTCSFHLDRFWGLNKLDQREERIGQHAFWKTDVVFTADGGNDDKFAARGVKHIWMPPAVVERDCYFGIARPQYNSPIAFTGADGYHPEYPFRGLMVNRLRELFGSNFRVYQGVREANLNDLYASVRVFVGDHCFAGAPRYWSDRLPESTGRGAFIVYPKTEGLEEFEANGLVTYEPQNINDLLGKIRHFEDDDHQVERKQRRDSVHEYVKKYHTYTNRMRTVLETVGLHGA